MNLRILLLRWLDIGGYEKKMKKIAKVLDFVTEGWLKEQTKKMNSTQYEREGEDASFMSALLSRVTEEHTEDLSSPQMQS